MTSQNCTVEMMAKKNPFSFYSWLKTDGSILLSNENIPMFCRGVAKMMKDIDSLWDSFENNEDNEEDPLFDRKVFDKLKKTRTAHSTTDIYAKSLSQIGISLGILKNKPDLLKEAPELEPPCKEEYLIPSVYEDKLKMYEVSKKLREAVEAKDEEHLASYFQKFETKTPYILGCAEVEKNALVDDIYFLMLKDISEDRREFYYGYVSLLIVYATDIMVLFQNFCDL